MKMLKNMAFADMFASCFAVGALAQTSSIERVCDESGTHTNLYNFTLNEVPLADVVTMVTKASGASIISTAGRREF